MKFNVSRAYIEARPRTQRRKGAEVRGGSVSTPLVSGVSKSYVDSNFVTLTTDQSIAGIKDFLNGFKIGGVSVKCDAERNALIFPCNVLVEGGVAAFSSINGFKPQTITDAVLIDGNTLGRNENGEIYVIGGTGGGGGGSIEYPLTWSGYSSGSYDGSASKNIAIPSLLSQLTNDVGFATSASVNSLLTSYVQKSAIKSELGISDWALASTKPSYTASEVGALSLNGGTVNGAIQAVRFISTGYGSVDYSGYRVQGGDVNVTYGVNPDTGGAYIWVSSNHALRFATNSLERVRITADGNMAIGGITADEKLHVYGNILATGGITAQNTSDRRLKQNIRDFDAIGVLRSMGGVHAYEYVDSEVARDKRYAGTHYGFIYQNVEGSELKRMCLKREDGYGTLNHLDSNLISVVAGGVLSLDDRVKLLEQENEHLREEINRLKTSLS